VNSTISRPEVQFRVEFVRVALWPASAPPAEALEERNYKVTVERQRNAGASQEYTDVLDARDIPKAILALKKAHDYIRNRQRQPPDAGRFTSAAGYAPERIP
jgi:hypothetical protein